MTRVIIASAGLNGVSLAHYTGREIAPTGNTGANATKFFTFHDQIPKIRHQIGD